EVQFGDPDIRVDDALGVAERYARDVGAISAEGSSRCTPRTITLRDGSFARLRNLLRVNGGRFRASEGRTPFVLMSSVSVSKHVRLLLRAFRRRWISWTLARDSRRILIGTQTLKRRMPDSSVVGPLGEGDLRHQRGPHPTRGAPDCGGHAAREWRVPLLESGQ